MPPGATSRPVCERAQAAQLLQVERQQDHRAHHREERHGLDDDADRVGAVGEDAQVEQRHVTALQRALAQQEDGDHGESGGDQRRGGKAAVALRADPAEAVDEGAEAERREDHARDVECGLLGLADVGQLAQREPGDDPGDRQHQPEQPAPRGELEHDAGHGRAERGGDRDREHHVAHHPAAVVLGHDRHQRRHQQRQHHRGAGRLHDPAGDEQREDRRECADRRTEEEDGHRGRERLAGGDPLQEPAGDRDDDGHGQHERGRQPLRAARGHVELDHEPRDRVDHDRLVEDHHERGEHEPAEHGVRRLHALGLLAGDGRRCFRHGCSLEGVAGGGHAGADRDRGENSSDHEQIPSRDQFSARSLGSAVVPLEHRQHELADLVSPGQGERDLGQRGAPGGVELADRSLDPGYGRR